MLSNGLAKPEAKLEEAASVPGKDVKLKLEEFEPAAFPNVNTEDGAAGAGAAPPFVPNPKLDGVLKIGCWGGGADCAPKVNADGATAGAAPKLPDDTAPNMPVDCVTKGNDPKEPKETAGFDAPSPKVEEETPAAGVPVNEKGADDDTLGGPLENVPNVGTEPDDGN